MNSSIWGERCEIERETDGKEKGGEVRGRVTYGLASEQRIRYVPAVTSLTSGASIYNSERRARNTLSRARVK